MDIAIRAEGLRKRYGGHEAVRGVDLSVPPGTVLGLLGPNGAGKTSIVRILATLQKPDAGHAVVAGFDTVTHPQQVRARIGLAGQYAAVDNQLTGRENLVLLGILLGLGRRGARGRADELLHRFELTGKADRLVATYSGGLRRRLDLATCLIATPPVVFLDEPTTGLDPASRQVLWELVREQVSTGTTILLTTQYLEEADQLADRIAMLAGGEVIAEGTADMLKTKIGGARLEFSLARFEDVAAAVTALAGVATESPCTVDGRQMTVQLTSGFGVIAAAATALESAGLDVIDFGVRRPSLDEVFLALTGEGGAR
ncbi:daunorubicin/doxorubicin resistance ABC transporter ATP-binding protein DrrA [Amycolatopsis coloradensis]|uniref:Daunorubicin/doxorubicin resistance ABC transporter ATP-binding protein DrrA n=1 Tax=Amycolatopsis coloradensis TaxID=76021 RepID=A0A1R0KQU7_9PSEU|nr:ATP-binding cassette domain-containing protein [Amycolatopsis coloradensis]OLZ50006.1 daunorubicin/doxorubicin resistance ABC transporter ATP-binding protein DrrA [Amycolatopsis coloradensis]